MSYSISTLLTRNLQDVFGENDPVRRRAAIDEIWTEDRVFYDPKRASTVAATRSIASQARSGLLILTFDISQSRNPRNWAMAAGSGGYRASLVRRQLTPGLTSLLPGTARLPPFISFSTSYPELDEAAMPT
jgi:RecB family exonuclease